jgi:hypothetical protein
MLTFTPDSIFGRQFAQQREADLAVADATAEREGAAYEAAANRETAARTGALARTLAEQRRTPGGGIRMAGNRRMSASSAGGGLNRANAAAMTARRRAELRAQANVADVQRQSSFSPKGKSFKGAAGVPALAQGFTIYR